MLVIEIFPRGFSLQNYKLFLLIFQTSFPSRVQLPRQVEVEEKATVVNPSRGGV
jgi:hypothetical protein